MLTNDREKSICARYSARDAEGFVHCKECPLVKDIYQTLCKANAHYDRHSREWVLDEETDYEKEKVHETP